MSDSETQERERVVSAAPAILKGRPFVGQAGQLHLGTVLADSTICEACSDTSSALILQAY